jgi:cell cycle arrest protein BUB3
MASEDLPEPRLLDKFTDGISALHYLPSSAVAGAVDGNDHPSRRLLASTSWDGLVRVHDTSQTFNSSATSASLSNAMLAHNMESGPLLSLATPSPPAHSSTNSQLLVTGGLDGSVKVLDMTTSTINLLGRHSSGQKAASDEDAHEIIRPGVSCLAAVGGDHPNLIVSASWSRQLSIWDLRLQQSSSSDSSSLSSPVATMTLPGKAFSMDVDPVHSRILVATSGRQNCIFDIRKGGGDATGASVKLESTLQRESSLKFQTRSVRFFHGSGDSFCIASIEGRVGVEYLDDITGTEGEKRKKYAFKCHRVNDTVYPVNVLACHPKFQTVFATGGCDGTVVMWDAQLKKKLTSLPKFLTSISALAFSYDEELAARAGGKDATELAIASSYTYEEGDREHPQDELYVRQILDSECEPKK